MNATTPSLMTENDTPNSPKIKRRRGFPSVIDNDTGAVKAVNPRQRTPLRRLEDVRRELGRLYRAVKAGHLPSDEGWRRAAILNTLSRVIVESDLEKRLERLERQQTRLLPGALPRPGDAE
jgi:hypothetical protein